MTLVTLTDGVLSVYTELLLIANLYCDRCHDCLRNPLVNSAPYTWLRIEQKSSLTLFRMPSYPVINKSIYPYVIGY